MVATNMTDIAVNQSTGEVEQYEGQRGDGLRIELTNLNNGGSVSGFYSSMKSETFADRIKLSAALSASQPIAETILGKPLFLSHVIIQAADMTNEQTGEPVTVPRVVLVDEDGHAYHGISGPLYRDATNLLGIAGDPARWAEPVAVQVTREGSGTRKYFTMATLGLKSDVLAAAKSN